MTTKLLRGDALSKVAAAGGVVALQHESPRANLISILREGALVPASARKGPVAHKAPSGDGQPQLGDYGFNRVFLSAAGIRHYGARLFVSPKEAAQFHLPPEASDHVILLFSTEVLDHPRQGDLSHLGVGWSYGEGGVKPNDAEGVANFIYRAASGAQNELVFKSRVPLEHLKAILVPPRHLADLRADLERNHVALPAGVSIVATDRFPGDTKEAIKWLSQRPQKTTRTKEGYVMVEDL